MVVYVVKSMTILQIMFVTALAQALKENTAKKVSEIATAFESTKMRRVSKS